MKKFILLFFVGFLSFAAIAEKKDGYVFCEKVFSGSDREACQGLPVTALFKMETAFNLARNSTPENVFCLMERDIITGLGILYEINESFLDKVLDGKSLLYELGLMLVLATQMNLSDHEDFISLLDSFKEKQPQLELSEEAVFSRFNSEGKEIFHFILDNFSWNMIPGEMVEPVTMSPLCYKSVDLGV